MLKINHNLGDVVDYVESLKNDILAINSQSIEAAKYKLYNELSSMYGESFYDANINIQQTSTSDIAIEIENIDFNYIYQTKGVSEDELFEYITDFVYNEIGNGLKEAGFEWQ